MSYKTFRKKKNSYLIVVFHLLIQVFIVLLLIGNVLADLYKFQNLENSQNNYVVKREVALVKYKGELNNLRGKPGQGYQLEVEIGTPKQKLHVLIDTGSSNFAVACGEDPLITTYFRRDQSSTYRSLGHDVHVPYTEGSWDGELGNDIVSIPTLPNVTVHANIACITKSNGFYINGSNWQGILGLGYAAISRPDSSLEPFMDTLVKEAHVENYFTMVLCGRGFNLSDPDGDLGGSLLFGGTDPSLHEGDVYSTPILKEWYYEVVIVDIEVNDVSLNMDCKEYNFGKTIVDSGTTNLRLPTKVFQTLIAQMEASIQPEEIIHIPVWHGFWLGFDYVCWEPGKVPYDKFPTISLVLPVNKTAAFKLVVSSQQYLRPVGKSNDTEPQDCFKLAITNSDSGAVIGATIMEGYYVVYNRAEKTMQFAQSKCNRIDPRAIRSSIQGNISPSVDYKDCAYAKIETNNTTLTIVGYVMAGLCGVCLIPLIIFIVRWQCWKCRGRRKRAGSDSNGLVDHNS